MPSDYIQVIDNALDAAVVDWRARGLSTPFPGLSVVTTESACGTFAHAFLTLYPGGVRYAMGILIPPVSAIVTPSSCTAEKLVSNSSVLSTSTGPDPRAFEASQIATAVIAAMEAKLVESAPSA